MGYRFDLSKKKGCSVASVVIRETTGADEQAATQRAKVLGDSNLMLEELIRVSITHVNDNKIEQPYVEFDRWNTRTRNLVLAAFKEINGTGDTDDFLASAAPYQD